MKPLYFALFETALGDCGIVWAEDGQAGVHGSQLPAATAGQTRRLLRERFPGAIESPPPSLIQPALRGIQRLLAGQARDHEELLAVPLDDGRVGAFERRVLSLTRHIPLGQTRTYGELAVSLGNPGAARAVGFAEAHNPFAPIVPCHRVMGAGGAPTGFSAPGGLDTKRQLLLIEARAAGQLAGDQQPLF